VTLVERQPLRHPLRLLVLVGGGLALVAVVGVCLFVWLGLFDVAATTGHSWPVAMLLHYTMERSVAVRAGDPPVPNLSDPRLIMRGGAHYASGCAPCHGAPGELASPIAQGMTPVPPGLYSAGRQFTPAELFWIVKHGVKMTAMPAWPAQERSDEIWAMVAFLRALPGYTTPAYAALTGWSGASFLQPSAAPSGFDPASCARCHGADGRGRDGAFPDIAGLDIATFVAALHGYRDGSRPSGFMQPVAAALSDEAMGEAANYYAALPRQAGSL